MKKKYINFKMNPLSTCLIHHFPSSFFLHFLSIHLNVQSSSLYSKPQTGNSSHSVSLFRGNGRNGDYNNAQIWIVMSLWYYEMIRKLLCVAFSICLFLSLSRLTKHVRIATLERVIFNSGQLWSHKMYAVYIVLFCNKIKCLKMRWKL